MPVQQMNQYQRKYAPVLKKMNAEEEDLSLNQRLDLILADKTVEKFMGPEPVPSLDIEMDEIQNELQRKMVEEIQCVVCGQFPYKALECRSCNKLFCKYCQIQLQKGANPMMTNTTLYDQDGNMVDPRLQEFTSAGRDGRGRDGTQASKNSVGGSKGMKNRENALNDIMTPDYDICCPNCQAKGDFLQEVNKVLKNCIDFCEFPHRCYLNDSRGEIIWKTLGELQTHAQYSCPKFGCDICYLEEYQHMTRAQLYDHIKRDCPAVPIMCQVCNKEYPRAEFANHQCIKEFYVEKLTTYNYDVLNKLVDKLILHRRQQEGLGLCSKQECVDKHRNSSNKYQQSMIQQIQENTACKCFRCKNVIAGYEDSYFCIYCNEAYCQECLGYCKWMDLEEMEQLLLK